MTGGPAVLHDGGATMPSLSVSTWVEGTLYSVGTLT